jgi:uncharacterized Tic20 family protein
MEEKEARTWAAFCHLSALSGFLIPFGNFLGPLILWLMKRNESTFVDDQGKEALNFQLTLFLAYIVAFILFFIAIGVFLMVLISIYAIIIIIYATIKANEGVAFRYPYIFRLIK